LKEIPDHEEIKANPVKYELAKVEKMLIKENAILAPKNNDPTMENFNDYIGY